MINNLQNINFSIIVPLYNEAENINQFYARLTETMDKIDNSYEIVFINDGSSDDTLFLIYELNKKDKRVKIINFSRNFGKENSLTAGIDYCSGNAVIIIDADLQEPPEIIPALIEKFEEGNDIVYAKRAERKCDSILKKSTAYMFYRVMNKIIPVKIPVDTGDFKIVSRQVIEAVKELREYHRFMKGIFSWVGFKHDFVMYNRIQRYKGISKFSYWKLWNFALDGITSFSFLPLQISSYLGTIIAFISLLYALFFLVKTLIFGNPVPGYPSLIIIMLFLGGIQLLSLGVIGEYLGRIYNESKKRPLYIIKSTIGFEKTDNRLNH